MYETVSIKPSKSGEETNDRYTPDGLSVRAVSLEQLITLAYTGLPFPIDSQIEGAPGWFKSDKFDIEAKVDDSEMDAMKAVNSEDAVATLVRGVPTMRMMMLQSLLEDRFKLKKHDVTRELPVYAMVVAKGGSRVGRSDTTDLTKTQATFGEGRLTGKHMPLSLLTFMLVPQIGRPVIDQTNLKGYYDFDLKWTPDGLSGEDAGIDAPPGLFTAIQEQLGLRLEATKGPVKVLVIDHVERPSEN